MMCCFGWRIFRASRHLAVDLFNFQLEEFRPWPIDWLDPNIASCMQRMCGWAEILVECCRPRVCIVASSHSSSFHRVRLCNREWIWILLTDWNFHSSDFTMFTITMHEFWAEHCAVCGECLERSISDTDTHLLVLTHTHTHNYSLLRFSIQKESIIQCAPRQY